MIVVIATEIPTNDVFCCGSELDGPKSTLVTMQGNALSAQLDMFFHSSHWVWVNHHLSDDFCEMDLISNWNLITAWLE